MHTKFSNRAARLADVPNGASYLLELPDELLLHIVSWCNVTDALVNLGCTCRRLRFVTHDNDKLWEKMYKENWKAQLAAAPLSRGTPSNLGVSYRLLYARREQSYQLRGSLRIIQLSRARTSRQVKALEDLREQIVHFDSPHRTAARNHQTPQPPPLALTPAAHKSLKRSQSTPIGSTIVTTSTAKNSTDPINITNNTPGDSGTRTTMGQFTNELTKHQRAAVPIKLYFAWSWSSARKDDDETKKIFIDLWIVIPTACV